MFDPIDCMGSDPYGLPKQEKTRLFTAGLNSLIEVHRAGCSDYKRILDGMGLANNAPCTLEDAPYLPVRIFKELDLKSAPDQEIVKTMTSSGTSGQAVSRIYLDRNNVRNQTRVLTSIISSFIGKKRLPLLVLDTEAVKRDRAMYSARGAGIVGFTTFGRDVVFALDDDMELKVDEVKTFLSDHKDERILMFGYTYMIWQHIVRLLEERGLSLDIREGLLFHIGGWKKLKDQAVEVSEFNRRARTVLGDVSIHNYYGMAEQLGSVFVECEYGHLHCSVFSDVLVRRLLDLSVASEGERGFLEIASLLPSSYPGHILLTEDEGEIVGEDDCPCGRLGKYFKIHGRVKGAEIRGCSDTYEQR